MFAVVLVFFLAGPAKFCLLACFHHRRTEEEVYSCLVWLLSYCVGFSSVCLLENTYYVYLLCEVS